MTRREIREQVFFVLFQIEFHSREELPGQMDLLVGEEDTGNKDLTYIRRKSSDIVLRIQEIDDIINKVAEGWKTARMGKVDLALIRLAVYEIRFEEDIPTGVAINEAVELAKKYGADESPSFVNGILARVVQEIG